MSDHDNIAKTGRLWSKERPHLSNIGGSIQNVINTRLQAAFVAFERHIDTYVEEYNPQIPDASDINRVVDESFSVFGDLLCAQIGNRNVDPELINKAFQVIDNYVDLIASTDRPDWDKANRELGGQLPQYKEYPDHEQRLDLKSKDHVRLDLLQATPVSDFIQDNLGDFQFSSRGDMENHEIVELSSYYFEKILIDRLRNPMPDQPEKLIDQAITPIKRFAATHLTNEPSSNWESENLIISLRDYTRFVNNKEYNQTNSFSS